MFTFNSYKKINVCFLTVTQIGRLFRKVSKKGFFLRTSTSIGCLFGKAIQNFNVSFRTSTQIGCLSLKFNKIRDLFL